MILDFESHLKKYGMPLALFTLLLAIGLLNWEGVKDADFFWQMQYGKYILENKTLVVDHSIYSWTPASNDFVYCSWVAQVALFLVYSVGGMSLAFAFLYLCVISMTFSIWLFAERIGKGRDALTFCVLIVLVLSTRSATYLKPEIFSMVFLALLGGLYFSVKAGIWKKWGARVFYFFPILLIIWVNTHGVFVIGLILLACITMGEIMNFLFKCKSAFRWSELCHLVVSSLLSLAATLINPYGVTYHQSLINNLFSDISKYRMSTVSAHINPFHPSAAGLHLKLYWLIMLISLCTVLLLYIWRKRSFDWGIFIPNLFLAYIFTTYIRTSFYWSAFWGLSLIFISREESLWDRAIRLRQVLTIAFAGISIFAAGQAIWEQHTKGRMSFDFGYMNPVTESEFLKKHRIGTKLYNSYNVGGYLLWDLYPTYKIFCDPRSFPYESWYEEYYNFNNGETPLEDFQKKYDFDVAIVDYISSYSPIVKFLRSKQWEPVYFGPIAMILVRKDVDFRRNFRGDDPHRFDHIKNLTYLYSIFGIAVSMGDMDSSAHILGLMKNNFNRTYQNYNEYINNCTLMQQGVDAYDKKDYQLAWDCLKDLEGSEEFTKIRFVMLDLRNWKAKELIQVGRYKEALELLEKTLVVHPMYIDGLYNSGILGYQIEAMEKDEKQANQSPVSDNSWTNLENFVQESAEDPIWKVNLKLFLTLAPGHRYAHIAKRVLEGNGLPPNVNLIL